MAPSLKLGLVFRQPVAGDFHLCGEHPAIRQQSEGHIRAPIESPTSGRSVRPRRAAMSPGQVGTERPPPLALSSSCRHAPRELHVHLHGQHASTCTRPRTAADVALCWAFGLRLGRPSPCCCWRPRGRVWAACRVVTSGWSGRDAPDTRSRGKCPSEAPFRASPPSDGGLIRFGIDLPKNPPLAGHSRPRTPRSVAGSAYRARAPANAAASFATAACFVRVSECR